MPKPKIKTMHVYLHRDFGAGIAPVGKESLYLQAAAVAVLGPIPENGTGYTFDVLWPSDAIDGQVDLDQAIALATAFAYQEGGLAEVRVSSPFDSNADEDDEDEWNDVTIFAIGPNKAAVERAARE